MVKVGEVEVYQVGSGPKCVIWCHDCRGPPLHCYTDGNFSNGN